MEEIVLSSGIKNGVSLTAGALAEIKRLMQQDQISADKCIRIGVKGGGCAGFSYVTEFDETKEGDTIFEQDGVRIAVDAMSELYLNGVVVDFQQGLNSRGFVYNNPNATKTCGCGESFG